MRSIAWPGVRRSRARRSPICSTQLASAPVPSLAKLDPGLPATLDVWCRNALSRDPELRFQSAGELADALVHAFHQGADSAESLNGLPAIPAASARASDNLSDAPLSRQRAYWDFVVRPGVRQHALRVSLGAVLGLLVVTLGVALVRTNPTRTATAEVSLPRRQEPARSIQTPAPGRGTTARPKGKPAEFENQSVAAVATPAPSCEALKVSRPQAPARDKTLRARTKRKAGGTLLDSKGRPDYGI